MSMVFAVIGYIGLLCVRAIMKDQRWMDIQAMPWLTPKQAKSMIGTDPTGSTVGKAQPHPLIPKTHVDAWMAINRLTTNLADAAGKYTPGDGTSFKIAYRNAYGDRQELVVGSEWKSSTRPIG